MVAFPSLRDIREILLPQEKLKVIANFIDKRRTLPIRKILEEIKASSAEDPNLEGVANIEEQESTEGRRLFIVVIDENYFPPNLLMGPGAAIKAKGVVFVRSGLSKRAEESVRSHEVYHLQNGAWAHNPSLPPIVRSTFRQLHEAETVLIANVLKDPIGTIQTAIEIGLKIPQTIIRFVAHFHSKMKGVLED